jgi:hypothetical protein
MASIQNLGGLLSLSLPRSSLLSRKKPTNGFLQITFRKFLKLAIEHSRQKEARSWVPR